MKDTATYIGLQVKSLMELIAEIDMFMPDEELVEVLIGQMSAWGAVEVQVLFPVLEAALDGSEETTSLARERLNVIHELQNTIHLGEGADAPFAELATKYIDALKYHLLVDIQEIVPLASQLPEGLGGEITLRMQDLKEELA